MSEIIVFSLSSIWCESHRNFDQSKPWIPLSQMWRYPFWVWFVLSVLHFGLTRHTMWISLFCKNLLCVPLETKISENANTYNAILSHVLILNPFQILFTASKFYKLMLLHHMYLGTQSASNTQFKYFHFRAFRAFHKEWYSTTVKGFLETSRFVNSSVFLGV